jgi:hypothetical protein
MAFSADELRVLRCALAHVLNPTDRTSLVPAPAGRARTAWTEDVQDVLRLAESIDEAVHEGGRMRAFVLADLRRYRAALPGAAAGYVERLEEAVADGYLPDADDLSALRGLTALPCAPQERVRRLGLRSRCGALAEAHGRPALAAPTGPAVSGDNVADFARPPRSSRPRDKSRPAASAAGVHPHPLPTRRGGPIPMAAFDTAARPAESGQPAGPPAAGAVRPVRAIPTPADLWPRGVRAGVRAEVRAVADEADELATGTG